MTSVGLESIYLTGKTFVCSNFIFAWSYTYSTKLISFHLANTKTNQCFDCHLSQYGELGRGRGMYLGWGGIMSWVGLGLRLGLGRAFPSGVWVGL